MPRKTRVEVVKPKVVKATRYQVKLSKHPNLHIFTALHPLSKMCHYNMVCQMSRLETEIVPENVSQIRAMLKTHQNLFRARYELSKDGKVGLVSDKTRKLLWPTENTMLLNLRSTRLRNINNAVIRYAELVNGLQSSDTQSFISESSFKEASELYKSLVATIDLEIGSSDGKINPVHYTTNEIVGVLDLRDPNKILVDEFERDAEVGEAGTVVELIDSDAEGDSSESTEVPTDGL